MEHGTALWNGAEHFVSRTLGDVHELLHAVDRRRHDRKAVCPSKLIAALDGLYRVVPFGRYQILHLIPLLVGEVYGLGDGDVTKGSSQNVDIVHMV